ncbi:MAG: MHYT domain-containing protein [Cyanobacteriota bacterium]|nr:MHYT domain-containing protein [Cyanobacteriota bacterium]
MQTTYNYQLVFLSYIIAVIASFAALNLGRQLKIASGRGQLNWLIGGAVAMGTGIWSMHFVAMLAFEIPQSITYNIIVVLISWLAGIVGAGIALFIVSRPQVQISQWLAGGVFMGVAIASMHYIGMAAIEVNAVIEYDWRWVTLSIIMAIVVSFIALALVFLLQDKEASFFSISKLGSALVLGGAICGMHYTGMYAACFHSTPSSVSNSSYSFNKTWLAISVSIGTLIILGLTFLTLFFDRKIIAEKEYNQLLEEKVQKRTAQLQELTQELEKRVLERTLELHTSNQQLEKTLKDLQATQAQLIQTEKMSSLGQMVAGIAHEINNPVSFIHGNLVHAASYTKGLLDLIQLYQSHYSHPPEHIQEKIEEIDLEFLQQDYLELLDSMQTGTQRIQAIVKSLRNFARLDEADLKAADIHEGLESALMLLRYQFDRGLDGVSEIQVIKNYEKLPEIYCYPGPLNQVFIIILINAVDELKKSSLVQNDPTIWISTDVTENHQIQVIIADNGTNLTEEIRSKMFDPFFTTKPVGQGTGLGLAIAYQIIVEKHQGQIFCNRTLEGKTEMIIQIPIKLNPE